MKKTIRRIAPAMLVLVGLTTLSFTAKEGISLRLKPKQDKTYTITTKSNMMNLMEVQGQSINSTQNMEYRQIFTAKSVTDKQTQIETQLEAIKMTISQLGMKLEYDSENPDKTNPMLAGQTEAFKKILNVPASVTYDALGNVIDSLDLEMSQLSSVIVKLPNEPLAVGSSWNVDKSQNLNGTVMDVKMTYTVTAISKKSVDVKVEGSVDGSEGISGTHTGTASFDPQTGFIVKSSMKSNVSMTLSEQGMNIPMTMVSNTTIEVK